MIECKRILGGRILPREEDKSPGQRQGQQELYPKGGTSPVGRARAGARELARQFMGFCVKIFWVHRVIHGIVSHLKFE